MAVISYPGLLEATLVKAGDGREILLVFSITYQNPKITKVETDGPPLWEFESADGFSLRSDDFIDLQPTDIWLLGYQHNNAAYQKSSQVTLNCSSISEADRIYSRAIAAFEEWANSEKYIGLWDRPITLDQLSLF